jgi:low temperature requirement protein LtrA
MKEVQKPRATSSRLVRPQLPRNLTPEQRAGHRAATWLELFFDLCFVVAVAALARGLHDDPSVGGSLRFVGLFVPIWWSWMIFSWFATSFDNDDVPYRVTLLAAMLFMLGLAAAVEGVGQDAGSTTGFVLAYAAMRLLLFGLWVRARRGSPPALRAFTNRYAAGNALGAGIWLSSLLVPEPGRYWVWAFGLAVELLAPILAVAALENPEVSFHPRHIPERYGLFTIIVLGESVLAVAVGTAGTDWAPAALLTAALGFVCAACVWWLYFDHVGESGMELEPRPAFYWGYGHLLVYGAIAAFGVGVQLAIEGAAAAPELALAGSGGAAEGAPFGLAGRLILGVSVAVFLVAVSFVQYVNRRSLEERVALVRLGAAALLVVLAVLVPLPPLAFVALVAAILLALTVFETRQGAG